MSAADPRHLSITRTLAAPRAAVWRCWVEGELLKQWFCPKPWWVSLAELDVRPGGASNIIMNGPNGEVMPNPGQYLEVVAGERLSFTDAFIGDWQPGGAVPFMVGHVTLADAPDGGTLMVWGARHWSVEATQQHVDMGFDEGWNAAADQLEALAVSLAAE
jgi:uncharacterized protein YndB with AHSA1/START domain